MSDLNIHQRVHAVMQDVSYVQKEDKKVNGQYTFVSHDAVTAKLREAFIKHGVISIPRVVSHVQDGNRTEVSVEVDFINIDKPEDRLTVPAFGYGIDPQDKGPGKAVSYAVKYAYLKTFALETGDDPERDNVPFTPPAIPDDIKIMLTDAANDGPAKLTEEWGKLDPETRDLIGKHHAQFQNELKASARKAKQPKKAA